MIDTVRAFLIDLIRASETPFSHGASAGVKFHSNPSVVPNALAYPNPIPSSYWRAPWMTLQAVDRYPNTS